MKTLTIRTNLRQGVLRLLLGLSLFGLASPILHGQEPPEAAAALFETQLGDQDVELFYKGNWVLRATAGLGWGLRPAGWDVSAGVSDLYKGFVFTQIPDFTISLWLMKRYYTEINYLGGFDRNTFLVGYQGTENEWLQSAKLGNAPIAVPGRAGMEVSAGRTGIPSLALSVKTDVSEHDLLIRYEDNAVETRRFRGDHEMEIFRVPIDGWIRGRFFRLPQTGLSGLEVWIQDRSGPVSFRGQSFRPVREGEAVLDPEAGEVRFPSTARGTVLVTYQGLAASGDPITGQPVAPVAVSGDARPFFELFRDGVANPWELKNRYPFPPARPPEQFDAALALVQRGTGKALGGVDFLWTPSADHFSVTASQAPVPLAPFYSAYPSAYTASGPTEAPLYDREISVVLIKKASGLSLGSGVLPGSVEVFKNGRPVGPVPLDPASGLLKWEGPLFPSDELEVRFQREALSRTSDLFIFQGNRIEPAPGQAWETATAFRWAFQQGRYTTEDGQAPGRFQSQIRWRQDFTGAWLQAEGRAGFGFDDTTGFRRLFGMTGAGTQARISSQTLRPSAVPDDPAAAGFFSGLTAANRGRSLYRNYFTTGLWGELVLSGTDKPGVGIEPYQDGGVSGPYYAAGDGTRTERLAVLEWDLSGGAGWTGFQVFPEAGRLFSLEKTGRIRLDFRLPQASPGIRIFLQLGLLGEDFDGTGAVKTLLSSPREGMAFQAGGLSLLYPLPESSGWTNDPDGRGFLRRDEREAILTWELPADLSSTGWQTFEAGLSPAEKTLLRRVNSYRVLVIGPGQTPQGILLTAGLRTDGSGFHSGTDGVSLREVAESQSSAPPSAGGRLHERFPDLLSVFHGQGEEPRVLEISWGNASSWTAGNVFPETTLGAYRRLVFHYRLPPSANSGVLPVTWAFTDAFGRGLRLTLPIVPSDEWRRVEIDLSGLAWKDSSGGSGLAVLDSGTGPLSRLDLFQAASSAGLLFVDEVYFEGAAGTWSSSGRLSARWTQPGSLQLAGFPLIEGTQLTLETVGDTQPEFFGRVQLKTGVLSTQWSAGWEGVWKEGRNLLWSAFYEASLPLGPLELSERFSDTGLREESLRLSLPFLGSWMAKGMVDFRDSRLRQAWQAAYEQTAGAGQELSWKAGLEWVHSLDRTIPREAPFAVKWLDTYPFLDWTIGSGLLGRTQAARLSLSLAPSPLGVRFEAEAGNSQTLEASSSRVSHDLRLRIEAPIRFKEAASGHWELLPSFSRRFVLTHRQSEVGGPFELMKLSALRLGAFAGWWGTVPLWEFFQTGSPWAAAGDDFLSGDALGRAELTFQRPRFQNAADLLVPQRLSFSYDQGLHRDGASLWAVPSASVSVQTQGLNLLGRLGSQPVFSFYDQDEWETRYALVWQSSPRPADRFFTQTLNQRIKLLFNSREEALWESLWLLDVRDKIRSDWTWTLRYVIRTELVLPDFLPRWVSPKAWKSRFDQSLSLDTGWNFADELSPLFRRLMTQYQADLAFSPLGTLTGRMKWGQEWRTGLYVTGLEAQLELKFSF